MKATPPRIPPSAKMMPLPKVKKTSSDSTAAGSSSSKLQSDTGFAKLVASVKDDLPALEPTPTPNLQPVWLQNVGTPQVSWFFCEAVSVQVAFDNECHDADVLLVFS